MLRDEGVGLAVRASIRPGLSWKRLCLPTLERSLDFGVSLKFRHWFFLWEAGVFFVSRTGALKARKAR